MFVELDPKIDEFGVKAKMFDDILWNFWGLQRCNSVQKIVDSQKSILAKWVFTSKKTASIQPIISFRSFWKVDELGDTVSRSMKSTSRQLNHIQFLNWKLPHIIFLLLFSTMSVFQIILTYHYHCGLQWRPLAVIVSSCSDHPSKCSVPRGRKEARTRRYPSGRTKASARRRAVQAFSCRFARSANRLSAAPNHSLAAFFKPP